MVIRVAVKIKKFQQWRSDDGDGVWWKRKENLRKYHIYSIKDRYTRGSLLPHHAPATRSRSKAPSSAPTISSEKICCATKLLLPSFAPSYQTGWIWGRTRDMRKDQGGPGTNLLHESVSGASSLACTEICLPWHDVSPVGQSNWLIFFFISHAPIGLFYHSAPSSCPSCALVNC